MLNIIYDATIIANIFYKDDNRSGVFFVAWNILKELQKRQDIRLCLYVNPEEYAEGWRLQKELLPEAVYIQDFSRFYFLKKVYSFFKQKYSHFYKHLYFRKIFAVGYFFSQWIFKSFIKVSEDEVKRSDFYLSPIYGIPEFVRKYPHLKPFVLLHDAIPLKFPKYYPYGKPLVKKIMETSCQGDSFFFVSASAYNDFKSFFSIVTDVNSTVIHLAADSCYSPIRDENTLLKVKKKYNIPVEKKYVFSLCTLEPRKNLIRSVRTFLQFVKKNGAKDIIWVMGGAAWTTFIDELEKAGVNWDSEIVVRAGYIDDEDLPILYSNAEWFVYTSQYEGFGLPPLEAMQCGCPVITSNNSSLPEVVGDSALTIDWDSDEQHIEAYEKYYFDEELRKEYGRKGLARAEQFSWTRSVNQIISVMERR